MPVSRIPRQPDAQKIYQHRRQSLAFAGSEEKALRLRATKPRQKIPTPLERAVDIKTDWANRDAPGDFNTNGVVSPPNKGLVPGVWDIDVHKTGEAPWTPDEEQLAAATAAVCQAAMEVITGSLFLHVWGRESQRGTGHGFFKVRGTKGELEALRKRTATRAIPFGKDMTFRCEWLHSTETKDQTFALPGSTYLSRIDPHAIDLIIWRHTDDTITETSRFEETPSVSPETAATAFYAATLVAVTLTGWSEGSHHDASMRLAGIMARDITEGLYDRAQAEQLIRLICTFTNDAKVDKRIGSLDDAIRTYAAGRPVYSFRAFGEHFGEAAVPELVRLRGRGDPAAFDNLREKVIYAQNADGVADVYISTPHHRSGQLLQKKQAVVNFYSNQPDYPPVLIAGKRVPLINLLLASGRVRTTPEARSFPGIPFGTHMLRTGALTYRPATEEEIHREECIFNLGSGYETALLPESEINMKALASWRGLFDRHLGPVCNHKDDAMLFLKRVIAFKLQHPLEKPALGVCLAGGGGIGKSSLFNQILPAVIGSHLVGLLPIDSIARTPFFASDLPGKLFILCEEAGQARLPKESIETLKDLMKNPVVLVNRKNAQQFQAMNYSVPIFLTNNLEFSLNIEGAGERSLRVIRGVVPDDLDMADFSPDWIAYQAARAHDLVELLDGLKAQDMREAALFDLMTMDLGPNPRRLIETPPANMTDVVDPIARLSPLQTAIVEIVERYDLSFDPDAPCSLSDPFKMEWFEGAILRHMRDHSSTRHGLTKTMISRTVNTLFRDRTQPDIAPLDDCRPRHDPPKEVGRLGSSLKRQYLKYFRFKYGTLLANLERNTGVKIEPRYVLDDGDYGKADVPKEGPMWQAIAAPNPLDKK